MKKAKKMVIAILAVVTIACCILTACSVHTHVYSSVGTDSTNHWNYCAKDNAIDESSVAPHTFEQKADGTNHRQECTVCGYIEEGSNVAHTSKVVYDENQHWTVCEVCSHVIVAKADHTWGDKHDSDNCWQQCTVCGAKQGETAIGTVSGTISLHKANVTTAANEATLVITKDGAQVTPIEQNLNADGTYTVLLLPGEYVFNFAKEGYIAVEKTVTVTTETPATQDVVLEFESVKLATIPGFNADKHDFSHMNDENPYVTYLGQDTYEDGESGMLNFQTVAAYDSATFSFLAKKGQSLHRNEERVGVYVQFYSVDEEGNEKVDYVWYTIKGAENKVEWFGMQMTEMGSANANNLLVGSWNVENGNLTETEIAAFTAGTLKISLARHENYLFAMVGDRVCQMIALDRSYASKPAYFGMLGWKPAYLEGANNFYYTISDFDTTLVPAKVNAELTVSGVDCDVDGNIGTLTFTNEFGSFDFDVEDNKVNVQNLYVGTYTVTADDEDLLATVIEIKDGVNAIAFAKKQFEDHIIISNWGDHITQYYSMANGRVEGNGKGNWVINKSIASYDKVAVTLNLDSRKYTDGWPMLQGVFVMFDNGEYLWVTTQDNGKTEWSGYDNFQSEGRTNISNSTWNNYGEHGWALYDCNGNTIYGANGLSEDEKAKFEKGTLPLTMVRDGARIYLFLDGKLVGARVLGDKYATMKAYVGISSLGAKNADEVYTYSLETDITEYAKSFGDANFKFDVTGADANITVTNDTSACKIGDLAELSWAVDEGYVVKTLKINGKDVDANIASYKYYLLEKGQTVTVEFTVEYAVYDVTLAVTADESVKKLTFTAQDVNYSKTLDIVEGKVSGKLVYGKYKVTADAEGFIPTIITVGEETTAITVAKKEIADDNMNSWGGDKIDESYNAATGKVELKLNDDWIAQQTANSYKQVAITIYVGGNYYIGSDWLKSQGVIFWFGEDYVWLNACGGGNIEWGNGWATQWKGNEISTTVPNKIVKDGVDSYKLIDAEGNKAFGSLEGDYLNKWNNGTLPLTLVRDGSTVYVFLDGKLIGARTFDAKYADMEVYGGLCYTGCKGATVNYLIETDITEYAKQFGDANFKFEVTCENEHVTVKNDTSACKIGDVAELTWDVKNGYVVKSVKVNGTEIDASATSYKYYLLEKGQTVNVEFVIEAATTDTPEADE